MSRSSHTSGASPTATAAPPAALPLASRRTSEGHLRTATSSRCGSQQPSDLSKCNVRSTKLHASPHSGAGSHLLPYFSAGTRLERCRPAPQVLLLILLTLLILHLALLSTLR